MTEDAPLLTVELLEALAARWQAIGAPVADLLQPGLSDEEMDHLTEPLGLHVPYEARVWWGWHDGAPSDRKPFQREISGAGWKFFSLSRAVQEAEVQRRRAEDIAGSREEAERILWRWAWLPLSDDYHGGVIYVDGTADPDEGPTPIYYTEPEIGTRRADRPSARSFGEMVTWWIEAFDDGIYGYDAEQQCWTYDFERLSLEREKTFIV